MENRREGGREPELDFDYNAVPPGYENEQGLDRPSLSSESYQFDPDRRGDEPPLRRRFGPLLVLALGILTGGVAAWMLLGGDTSTDMSSNQIPLVRADQTPLRTKPDDPGGMDVPNRDKLVYEKMDGSDPAGAGNGTERLLPPPEAPRSLPPSSTAPPVVAAPLPQVTESQPIPLSTPAESPAATTPRPPEPASPAAAEPTVAASMPAKPSVPTPGAGNYTVQLASVSVRADADKEWARLRRTHADLLGSLTLDVQKADLGEKGIFYRVRGGTIDEASARRLCAELSKRKVGCIVAKK